MTQAVEVEYLGIARALALEFEYGFDLVHREDVRGARGGRCR